MRCYRALHEQKLLGKGDKDDELWTARGYDLTEVFELVGLDIKMLYGGPKEAVMHAIYRQNLGFTDIVIGRKHADAPFDDGSPFGATSSSGHLQEPSRRPAHQPCNIGFAAYFESAGRVDLMELHPKEEPVSSSQARRSANHADRGTRPDPRVLRPNIHILDC